MKVCFLDRIFQFFSRYLSRIIDVHFSKLLLQISYLFSINHFDKHVHSGFLKHTNSLELPKSQHYVPIDSLGAVSVFLALFFDLGEPYVLECFAGRKPLFRIYYQ